MSLPTSFSNNKNPTGPQLDGDLLAVAAMAVTATSVSGGPNALTLTPLGNQPDVTGYVNLAHFSFVPLAASTGAVTAQVNSLGFVPVYLSATQQAGNSSLSASTYYEVVFLQALNTGSGGFLIYSSQAAVTATILRGFIGGLALSNDGSTPNSVLDVAQGICADSTAATYISLNAITKSTAGAWVTGSGGNGMGAGLTIATSTWYFVFAIINLGVADVYFDTSVTAANKPTNTTSFRLIGMFKTDGSAHVLPFTQTGTGSYRRYIWTTAVVDQSGTSMPTTRTLFTLPSVPNGVKVVANINAEVSGTLGAYAFYPPDMTSPPSDGNASVVVSGKQWNGWLEILTNTAQQIAVSGTTGPTFNVTTQGWSHYV